MDKNTVNIWYNKVYQPYIADCAGKFGLLLDDFKILRNPEILQSINEGDASRYMIPLHYIR